MQDYTKLIPYASAFIIFLGVYRLILYYFCFGVNIIRFLEFSEILTSFFDYIIFFSMMFFISVAFLVISKRGVLRTSSIVVEDKENMLKSKYEKALERIFKYGKIILVVIPILMFLIFFTALFHYEDTIIEEMLGYFILTGIILMIPLIFEISKRIRELALTGIYRNGLWAMVAGIFVVLLLSLISLEKVRFVKSENAYYGVKFTIDQDSTVVSTQRQYYIGNTNNYLFFYDETNRTTQVIPMIRVKNITFPNRVANKMWMLF